MTNSISTAVVEVTKNIHDSYNDLITANVKVVLILCQVVMTKTLTGYDVIVYIKMS